MLCIGDEPHDDFDASSIVRVAIENDDLAG